MIVQATVQCAALSPSFVKSVPRATVAFLAFEAVAPVRLHRRDVNRRRLHQPDMAIDAGPFVKPAFTERGIHPHGQHVLPP